MFEMLLEKIWLGPTRHLWGENQCRSLGANEFRDDLARSEYLSSVDERLQWQQNSLPVDDLCVENAIMLKVSLISRIISSSDLSPQ